MSDASPEAALARAAAELTRREVRFALVGGLGVSIRGEVRFTRDVGPRQRGSEAPRPRLVTNESLDMGAVRALLDRITERGFHRDQDLKQKLDALLASADLR